jgi:hypothetical protein
MTIVPKDDFRPLLYLVPLGASAAASAAVFFGIAYLWLTPPHPAEPPADLDLPGVQALEVQEVPPPANNDTAWRPSTETPADNATASPIPSALSTPDAATTRASSNREAPVLESAALAPTLMPPAGITHAKRVRVSLYHRQVTARHWAALWRPDARAGPLPGGGFYGPPNINVGYINPR